MGALRRSLRNCIEICRRASEFGFNCFSIGDLVPMPKPDNILTIIAACSTFLEPRCGVPRKMIPATYRYRLSVPISDSPRAYIQLGD